jgi:hypothetical protein
MIDHQVKHLGVSQLRQRRLHVVAPQSNKCAFVPRTLEEERRESHSLIAPLSTGYERNESSIGRAPPNRLFAASDIGRLECSDFVTDIISCGTQAPCRIILITSLPGKIRPLNLRIDWSCRVRFRSLCALVCVPINENHLGVEKCLALRCWKFLRV